MPFQPPHTKKIGWDARKHVLRVCAFHDNDANAKRKKALSFSTQKCGESTSLCDAEPFEIC